MPSIHRFSAFQRQLRDDWFTTIETHDSWVDEGSMGEGESASIRVRNVVDRMIGVAKPGPPKAADEGHCRAAHEKLAFDLGYLAGLPICAVVLWPHDMPDQYKRGRAISSWAFGQAMKWSEAERQNLITPASKESAGPAVSMLRVFHSWIGDGDRKPDHLMIDLDSPDGDLRVAAIDHGHSMSLYWHGPGAPLAKCPVYLGGVPEDKEALAVAADHIAGISGSDIEGLINRLPIAYLPDPKRGHILSNLLGRKGNLRGLYGV